MIRYVFLAVMLLCSSIVYAEATDAEMKAQIGSIDDSGRVNPDEFEFSNTENKLWMDKHLSNINQPARLHYVFEKTGTYEEGFEDDVYLDVVKINVDGTRNTSLDFFSSDRKQGISADNVMNVTGNPVIGTYLQGDVYEMNRLTGGNWKYFMRELKLAMADSNESETINIDFNEKQYQGEKITLYPFGSDKNKLRLKEFSDKTYEFILSDKIPGKLYQIKSVIKDSNDLANPLMIEKLTLTSVVTSPEMVSEKDK